MAKTHIEKALAILRENYIFPDVAASAASEVEVRLARGEYEGLEIDALCARLSEQISGLCGDQHVRVRVRDPWLSEAESDVGALAVRRVNQRLGNYGIARVERLDGNIGLIDLRAIAEPVVGGHAIAAAMELVSGTHALIFDLRANRGGEAEGVQFWNSYLFADSETHLNSIHDRTSGRTREYWTLPYVPGRRYLDRPVYVLTSGRTFSAGEEFCYNLRTRERAILIGETTRGGAHPTKAFPVDPAVEIMVPYARSVNPVTGANWERVGVSPDVAVPAAEAFREAYGMALRHVTSAANVSPAVLAEATAALER